ncbi:MAG: hypothetical protein M5U22_09330 [Thermoleophilia bacterium]|nr:hypothetical protein [Thermoleophilia bacterium]
MAEYNDLLEGTPLADLSPWSSMPRGEVAQVLHNLLVRMAEDPGTQPPDCTAAITEARSSKKGSRRWSTSRTTLTSSWTRGLDEAECLAVRPTRVAIVEQGHAGFCATSVRGRRAHASHKEDTDLEGREVVLLTQ